MTFQRPHPPWSMCPECAGMYDPDDIDLPESVQELFERSFEGKPAFQRERTSRRGIYGTPENEADLRQRLAFYYALITSVDEQIGRVIDYLCETDELDNTVIVYVADHGDFAGEHGLTYKNLGIYESIHRIPFLLRYPNGPRGKTESDLIESVDLYPTLCDLMDIPVPDIVEGRSLLQVIEGGAPGKEAVVCEWSWTLPTPMVHAVRTPDYRLVYYGRDQEGELYDRRTDPDEMINVYDDPAYALVRIDLLECLFDHVAKYEKRSTLQRDAVIARQTRNMPTRQIQFGKRKWSEVKELYRP